VGSELGETGKPWTVEEVELTVETYFAMLRADLLGQSLNKAEHNRRLQTRIPARSIDSIEYKHRNISAVLIDLGLPPLTGYKPLPNYQRLLVEVVAAAVATDRQLDAAAIRQVETPAEPPVLDTFDDFVVDMPAPPKRVAERRREWVDRVPVKRDYLARESNNRALGLAGELLVMDYEARRLHGLGAKVLADRIEHVSVSRGDGAGFDILSFDSDGRERFIEVKTTAYVAETPFFVSPNEVEFSAERPDQFHLYRLFEFRKKPHMFDLPGHIATHCALDPVSFRATLLA
jgi:hypothetical protein